MWRNTTASSTKSTHRSSLRVGLYLVICLVGLCLAGIFLSRVGQAQVGQALTRFVAPGGTDSSNCTDADTPCVTVQYAIDRATPGDEVYVAAGIYTVTTNSVVVISKTVTLLGGWDAAFAQRNPISHSTVLDAQRRGPVIRIAGDVSPTIDGFVVTGGNGSNTEGQGGGVHSLGANPRIINCVITNNVAYMGTAGSGYGGGIYLQGATATVISGNVVISNAASTGSSDAQGLLASVLGGGDFGGGLCILDSTATISNNRFVSNTASSRIGQGGGITLLFSSGTLFSHNDVQDNVAGVAVGSGGGLFVLESDATIRGNRMWNNVASVAGQGRGGGLFVYGSDGVILDGNWAISNSATLSVTAEGHGGGLYLANMAPFTASNNVVARNRATSTGGGILIEGISTLAPINGLLVNNTLAENNLADGGEGVVIVGVATLTLANNIIVSHTAGITYSDLSGVVVASHNLFDGNVSNPITGTHAIFGSPRFVDSQIWDYHLRVNSAAINQGTLVYAPPLDIDGEPRPDDCFVDIGADEFIGSMRCERVYLPIVLRLPHPIASPLSN